MTTPSHQISELKDLSLESLNGMVSQVNRALIDIYGNKETLSAGSADSNLIWDHIVESPTTSIDSPALDGNAHYGYKIDFAFVLDAGSVRLYFNNDKTNANYRRTMYYTGPTTGTASEDSDPPVTVATNNDKITGEIILSDGYVYAILNGYNLSGYRWIMGIRYIIKVSNLTMISLMGDSATIKINSHFRLWKRK